MPQTTAIPPPSPRIAFTQAAFPRRAHGPLPPRKLVPFPAHGEGDELALEEVLGVDIYLSSRYNKGMIVSFRDKETAKVYQQEFSKKLPQAIQRLALRKLMMIDNASSLNDLRIPPANHLEQLSGQRKDEYSIRINKQYRICFRMDSGNRFYDVQIEDYH